MRDATSRSGERTATAAARVKKLLEREPGAREAKVCFRERRARVRSNECVVGIGRLVQLVENAGFEITGRS